MRPPSAADRAMPGNRQRLHLAERQRGRAPEVPEDVVDRFLATVEEPGRLADLVASYLDVSAAEKQMLLETSDVEERLRMVLLQIERRRLRCGVRMLLGKGFIHPAAYLQIPASLSRIAGCA